MCFGDAALSFFGVRATDEIKIGMLRVTPFLVCQLHGFPDLLFLLLRVMKAKVMMPVVISVICQFQVAGRIVAAVLVVVVDDFFFAKCST